MKVDSWNFKNMKLTLLQISDTYIRKLCYLDPLQKLLISPNPEYWQCKNLKLTLMLTNQRHSINKFKITSFHRTTLRSAL